MILLHGSYSCMNVLNTFVFAFQDVVRYVCKELKICPKTSAFFGLSFENDWLIQTKKFDAISIKQKLVLMVQFKVFSSNELKKYDEEAYLYYVKQVCNKLNFVVKLCM